MTSSRDAPLPAKVAPLPVPVEISVEDASQIETAQELAELQERQPKLEKEEPAETCHCQRAQPVTNMKVPRKQGPREYPAPHYDNNPDTRILVGDMVSYVYPEKSQETRGPWTWVVTLVTKSQAEGKLPP